MDPEAQLLIELARETDNPSPQDRARVRRGLALTLGAGVLASAGGSAAAATASTTAASQAAASAGAATVTAAAAGKGAAGVGLALGSTASMGLAKLATWGGIGFIAGATTIGVTVVAVDAMAPAPVTTASFSAAPKSAVVPLPSQASTKPLPKHAAEPREYVRADEKSTERAPATVEQGSMSRGKQPSPSKDPLPEHLGGELPLIEQAQQALQEGNPQRTLSLLGEHERKFPNGMLSEERLAGKALALCQLGQVAEARRAADVLRRSNPHSPLWPRVVKACAFED